MNSLFLTVAKSIKIGQNGFPRISISNICCFRFHIRDVTGLDGGEGVFSRMHHDMENVIRGHDKKNSDDT